MQRGKNRSTFDPVITKVKRVNFFETQCSMKRISVGLVWCICVRRLEKEIADRTGMAVLVSLCATDAFPCYRTRRVDSVSHLTASQRLLAGKSNLVIV